MKILLIHPKFPGQFRHIASFLGRQGHHEIVFISGPTDRTISGVKNAQFKFSPPLSKTIHPYLRTFEKAVFRGQAVWEVCNTLKIQGFQPDIIVSHVGWGDALFVKDLFGDVPLLGYFEFFYRPFGADIHFYPDEPVKPDVLAQIRINNANNLLNLEGVDWGISPTFWQKNLHPKVYQDKITVLHEGIDLIQITPEKTKPFLLPNGLTLSQSDEVLTYIAQKLEPYRGFEEFLTSLVLVLKKRPNCQVIILGEEGVLYGKKHPDGFSLKDHLIGKLHLDLSRIHFLGIVEHQTMLDILGISTVHVYLTIPFVLSWSLIEAMAKGCLIIASDVAPVQEIITHPKNGLLVDMRDPGALSQMIIETLSKAHQSAGIRNNARKTVEERFDQRKILPLYDALISELADGKIPPPAHQNIMELFRSQNEIFS